MWAHMCVRLHEHRHVLPVNEGHGVWCAPVCMLPEAAEVMECRCCSWWKGSPCTSRSASFRLSLLPTLHRDPALITSGGLGTVPEGYWRQEERAVSSG